MEFLRSFARIGLMFFGGPAAQISLMHEGLVERRQSLSEKQFGGALSFCMPLPLPEAMQLAANSGWRLRGVAGGLFAGLLFVPPGALVIANLTVRFALHVLLAALHKPGFGLWPALTSFDPIAGALAAFPAFGLPLPVVFLLAMMAAAGAATALF